MPRRLLLLMTAAATLATGCTLGGSVDTTDTPVEVPTPGPAEWRRTVSGLEVLGVGTAPDAAEMDLLAAALASIPEELWDQAGMRTIYRIPDDPAAEPGTLAFARGPDIYLTDATFSQPAGSIALEAAIIHELTHTAQFAALTAADIAAAGDDSDSLIRDSALVRSFSEAAGWVRDEQGWELPEPTGVLGYGSTAPEEDMAETVTAVVLGRGGDLSLGRVAWAEDWLGAGADALAAGRPYVPAGAVERRADGPLYDAAAVAAAEPTHVEPMYYALADDRPLEEIAREVAAALESRGLEGSLGRADGEPEHFAGFSAIGGERDYRVELWDLRAEPAGHVLLVYVALW